MIVADPVAVAIGASLRATVVSAGDVSQLSTVATTEYVPEAARVALEMVGFWRLDVKPPGPVHP